MQIFGLILPAIIMEEKIGETDSADMLFGTFLRNKKSPPNTAVVKNGDS